jgi:hypothetical protein
MRNEINISKAFKEGRLIDEGIQEGINKELLRHKKLGNSIVIWRDGKVVWLPPEEIVVPAEPVKRKKPRRRSKSG